MNLNHCTLIWAGGMHRFRLASTPPPTAHTGSDLERLREQARSLRAGAALPAYLHDRVGAVMKRLLAGDMGSEDVSDTIRCGLIGGGDLGRGAAAWAEAAELVERFVLDRPLSDSLALAQTICLSAVVGIDPVLADTPLTPVMLATYADHEL